MPKSKWDVKNHRKRMSRKVLEYISQPPQAMYDIGVGPKFEWKHLKEIRQLKDMELFGCEPDPRTFQWLRPQFPGTLRQIAIGREERKSIRLTQYKKWGMTSLFNICDEEHGQRIGTVDVPCWTLDYFDEQCHKPETILLWMDIEGMEFEALRSGEELLQSGRVMAINLESRSVPLADGWATEDELEAYLDSLNYERVLQYNNQHTHWDAIYLRKQS